MARTASGALQVSLERLAYRVSRVAMDSMDEMVLTDLAVLTVAMASLEKRVAGMTRRPATASSTG
jgi:hypothetical protein